MAKLAISLSELLHEARLQRARQPTPLTLVLEWRVPGETYSLLLSIENGLPRLFLTSKKWPNAPTPPRFLARIRKVCVGSRLTEIQLDDDIITFKMERKDGSIPPLHLKLNVGPAPEVSLSSDNGDLLERMTWKGGGQRKPPTLSLTGSLETGLELHQWIERQFEVVAEHSGLEHQRTIALQQVKAGLKRGKRLQRNVEQDLSRAQAGIDSMRWGELLKPVAAQLPAGENGIMVTDYSSPEMLEVWVPLEPSLNGLDNMKAYFRKGSRYKAALERIEGRLDDIRQRNRDLSTIRDRLGGAETEEEIAELIAAAPLGKRRKKQTLPATKTGRKPSPSRPYKEYVSRRGTPILVGRNAKANDRLTFTVGRSNDLWLHARGRRGAHALIPRRDKKPIHQECQNDAARLCAFFSEGGKSDSSVEVWVVERKHLRKPKGAPAGTVTYSGGKSIWVPYDETSTRELLNTLVEE